LAVGSAQVVVPAIPDYRGVSLAVAFADAVQRSYGIPTLVDGRGNKIRVTVLGDWWVVRQAGLAHCLVFVVMANGASPVSRATMSSSELCG